MAGCTAKSIHLHRMIYTKSKWAVDMHAFKRDVLAHFLEPFINARLSTYMSPCLGLAPSVSCFTEGLFCVARFEQQGEMRLKPNSLAGRSLREHSEVTCPLLLWCLRLCSPNSGLQSLFTLRFHSEVLSPNGQRLQGKSPKRRCLRTGNTYCSYSFKQTCAEKVPQCWRSLASIQ